MPENLFPQSDNSRALARPTRLSAGFMAAAAAVLIASLLVISRYNYLLFHTLAEFFTIAVGLALFLLLWSARRLIRQQALVFLGIAYLNIGILDLMHTISFKGMGVLAGPDTVNQSTQLWIAARGMEAVGTLAGGIAHDFNNILASILGYTELAREDVPAGSGLQQNLDEVLIAGNRARHLVDQILAISRQEKQEKTPLDIVPLVKEALKMLRSAIPSSIEMRETICREALVVAADPTQIHQVIVNLATNARQAMPAQKGVLEVAVAAEYLDGSAAEGFPDLAPGRYARISVSDNGSGIAPEHLEKIFEPYFTTKKKGQGTGLGLSVVHGIIRAHKGDIRVSSRLGKGSTFQVYLPVSDREPALESSGPEPQELPTGTEAILVVDDEVPVARMVTMHLQALGYRVSVQTESAAALKIFQSAPEKYDMVITDMTMPKMTGDQLARAVKEVRPELPVVLCTGFSEAIDADGVSALGIAELLMKPVDKAVLARMVRKLLDEQAASGSGY